MPDKNGWLTPDEAMPEDGQIIDAICSISGNVPWCSYGSRFDAKTGLPRFVKYVKYWRPQKREYPATWPEIYRKGG
jgi:hypothetical protein